MSARTSALAQRTLMLAAVMGLAVPVALVAIAEGAGQIPLPYNLHIVDLRLPVAFKLHMLASGLALLLIPFVIALRRDSRLHKPLGRLTAVAVVAGGLTSIPVAILSESVTVARAGFFVQGLVWMGLLGLGIRAIRQRRLAEHQRYMLSMAAVASGAIWVRLITAVAVDAPSQFNAVYGLAAWAGWLVPLGLAWHFAGRMLSPLRPRPL